MSCTPSCHAFFGARALISNEPDPQTVPAGYANETSLDQLGGVLIAKACHVSAFAVYEVGSSANSRGQRVVYSLRLVQRDGTFVPLASLDLDASREDGEHQETTFPSVELAPGDLLFVALELSASLQITLTQINVATG